MNESGRRNSRRGGGGGGKRHSFRRQQSKGLQGQGYGATRSQPSPYTAKAPAAYPSVKPPRSYR